MHGSPDDIWQTHAMKFLEMAFRVHLQERLHNADGHGKKSSDCGDTIEFFLIIQNNRIDTISYTLNGCINTNACANATIDLVEGKKLEAAWALTPEAVMAYLESLPEHHFHCAQLAVSALRSALSDARNKQHAPWKKMYH